MKKEQALERIAILEKETRELRKIIEQPDCNRPITERVKSFEDACCVLGILVGSICRSWDNSNDVAFKKLKIIRTALNDGWEPNWSNSNEFKYFPWFTVGGSGFGFSRANCDLWRTTTGMPSRLCFKSRELAEYAGKQFVGLYKDLMSE